MHRNPDRPMSPHLTIWKWGPHMLVSILHRVTGTGLAIVGGVVPPLSTVNGSVNGLQAPLIDLSGGIGRDSWDLELFISYVTNEDGISKMPALSFAGAKKRLALNKTNAKTMEKICDTPDPNLWRGWITLVVVSTKIAGERPQKPGNV